MPATSDWDKKHQRNLSSYEREVDAMFDTAVKEAARIADIIRELKGEKPFSFDDYPEAKKRVNKLLERLTRNVTTSVVSGIRSEWTLANEKNNELCNRVFGDKLDDLTEAQRRQYYTTNSKARQAFEQRRVNGLNLSDRVWNYTNQFKEEIEWGLDIGLREGRSAAEMARDLKQYLKYPDKLFRRVRDEHGNLRLSRNAKAFHPGMGVYRSSYKNARRLAVTETNMAYRTSDYERWQKLDFVVGMHIIRSNNHTTTDSKGKRVKLVDICDELSGENERDTKGRYPKSFKFTGWHPQCRCYAVSILKTEEERREDRRRRLAGEEPLPASSSVNYVGDVPQEFKTWVAENSERINTAKSLPYFISDNRNVVDGLLAELPKQSEQTVEIPPEIAKEYDKYADLFPDVRKWYGKYTPEEIKAAYDKEEFTLKRYAQLSTDAAELRELDEYLVGLSEGYDKDLKAVEVIVDYCQRRSDSIKESIKKREDWEKQWLLSKHKNTAIVTTLDEFDKLSGEDKTLVIRDKGGLMSGAGMLADKVLFDGASENWRNSSKGLKDSIHGYTAGSGHLNHPLQGRNFTGKRKQTLQQFTEDVNNTTEYISKESLPYDMVLKRVDDNLSAMEGRLNFMGKQMPADVKDLVGTEVKDFGFMSTTGGDAFTFKPSFKVVMYVYAPKGTKAAYVEPFSYYGEGAKKKDKGRDWDGVKHLSAVSEEDEVTLQRGTRYVIRRVEESRGKTMIWCDIVGQDPSDFSYVTAENLSH